MPRKRGKNLIHKNRKLTFPANGIRKGSVQNIPRRVKAIRDVLTAIDNSIGSSGGITEVIISEQLSKSLYLLLVGSSSPYINDILIITKGTTSTNQNRSCTLMAPFIYLFKYITGSYYCKYD